MVKRVETRKEWKRFVEFPHLLNKGDPAYVPQLDLQQLDLLGRKNPFFQHSEVACFLSMENGKVNGRIAAILNLNHLSRYRDDTGFFGFFDSYNRPEIARELLDAAVNWLREHSITRMIGPTNFTTNDTCGLLVDGFMEAPAMLMPYNKPYYRQLLLDYGFRPLMDLFQYRVSRHEWAKSGYHGQFETIEKRLEKAGITIRCIDFGEYDRDKDILRELYNQSNEDNWGFVPLTEAEFNYMATDLRQLVEAECVLIAEKDGEPIGFMVAIPDMTPVLQKIKDGKLLPFGWVQLLNWRKKVNKIRVMIMGVLPAYRNRGVDGVFYARLFRYMEKRNIDWAEPSYVMHDNLPMKRLLEHLNAVRVKTYQLMAINI